MCKNDLFLKSVKTPRKPDLDVLKNRNFLNYTSENFKPKKEKEVRWFNSKSIESISIPDIQFTNFLSHEKNSEVIERINFFISDIDYLKGNYNGSNVIDFNDNRNKLRLQKIMESYIGDFEYSKLKDDSIRKISIKDRLGMSETVRVYFMLTNSFDAYEIIMIDPHHLVIPSKKDVKGKKQKKNRLTQLNQTYSYNENNNVCISTLFDNE